MEREKERKLRGGGERYRKRGGRNQVKSTK